VDDEARRRRRSPTPTRTYTARSVLVPAASLANTWRNCLVGGAMPPKVSTSTTTNQPRYGLLDPLRVVVLRPVHFQPVSVLTHPFPYAWSLTHRERGRGEREKRDREKKCR